MSPEKRQSPSEKQLSFLNPPIHNMEDVAVFSLPEAKSPTLPVAENVPSSTQTIAPKELVNKTLWEKNYWHELPPTAGQIRDITRKCMILGIREPLEERVSNRMEARDMQYYLKGELNRANAERKKKRELKNQVKKLK